MSGFVEVGITVVRVGLVGNCVTGNREEQTLAIEITVEFATLLFADCKQLAQSNTCDPAAL